MGPRAGATVTVLCLLAAAGCDKPKHYTASVELLQVRRFGQGAGMVDLEMRYVDCPGDARRIMRGDKAFGECATKLKVGDRLSAELVLSYSSQRGTYRNDLVRLGDCPVKLDPKDEANYEIYQDCQELKASGSTVGVHCNRRREEGPLLAKCPWLRRR